MISQTDYVDGMENGAPERGREFAKLIRDARLRRSWTQDQLVADSGVSKSTIVRWENGRAERPDPDQVQAICRSLGVNPVLAAKALGYLTEADLAPSEQGQTLNPNILQVIETLEDPSVPDAEKEQWIRYLLYLRDQSRRGRPTAG